jgi:AraC-like DNA-binding protein
MQKYEVLQITSITQAVSYSAALKQMKLQLALARRLEQKDKELHNKDKIITNYEKEIVLLKASLAAGHGNDKRQNALNLKKLNPCMSNTAIAKAVGLGRTTVSNLFNQTENKLVDGCT